MAGFGYAQNVAIDKAAEVVNKHQLGVMMIKLLQGDCLERMKELPDNFIDLVIVDPPYLTTAERWDKEEVFNEEVIRELFRVAKDSCSIYVWCGIGEKSQSLIRWFPLLEKYFYFKDLITWKKQRGFGMRRGWLYTREEIMWFVKDNKKFVWNKEEQYSDEKSEWGKKGFWGRPKASEFKRLTNVWTDIPEQYFTRGYRKTQKTLKHPTSKPVKALERIIRLHTRKNDLVLDCFMGGGSTGVACKKLSRDFIGIEIDEEYFKVAEKRIDEEKILS